MSTERREGNAMTCTQLCQILLEGARAGAAAAAKRAADDAVEQLMPTFVRVVRSLHAQVARLRPDDLQDCLATLPGKITLAIVHSLPKFLAEFELRGGDDDPALGFLVTTARNHYHQCCREAKRRQRAAQLSAGENLDRADELPANSDDGEGAEQVDARDFWSCGFGNADAGRIETWDPVDAVVLLGASGLGRKLGREAWDRLVARAGGKAGQMPADFFEREHRRGVLAKVLGVAPNTIDQRWRRKSMLLRDLDFIKQHR
jgi:DNA-directed RNA polymerase specialized sigma24 family protein